MVSKAGVEARARIEKVVPLDKEWEDGKTKKVVDRLPIINEPCGWRANKYSSRVKSIEIHETKGSDDASIGTFSVYLKCRMRETFSGTSHGTKVENYSGVITGDYQLLWGNMTIKSLKKNADGLAGDSILHTLDRISD